MADTALLKPAPALAGQTAASALQKWARRGSVAAENTQAALAASSSFVADNTALVTPAAQLGGAAPVSGLRKWARRGSVAAAEKRVTNESDATSSNKLANHGESLNHPDGARHQCAARISAFHVRQSPSVPMCV